ncbi:MAG: hypothetical protein Q4G25_03110 [Paracoccus sp. (in: a-proteobacteria)]|nr:hypothetical protein [Paracoccus sp. (in: a-proteobacteria)]
MKWLAALLASFALGVTAGVIAGPFATSRMGEIRTMADPMEYAAFRDKAVAELATHEDLIGFDAQAPLLQEMRADPRLWAPLLRELMADQTVALEVKLGALPAIFDLPAAELVDFSDHLNTLSLMDPGLFRLVMLAVTNPYRGGGFVRPGMVADMSLLDLETRVDARSVLTRIARNPALDQEMLAPGMLMSAYAPAR